MLTRERIAIGRGPFQHADPSWWIRQLILWNATAYDGTEAGTPDGRHELTQLLGPLPAGCTWPLSVPFAITSDGVQGVSTCGLVAEGILDLSGVDCPWHGKPYTGGTIRRLLDFAGDQAACDAPDRDWFVGDVLVWARGNDSHAAIVVRRHPLETIDGGQTDALGLQAIGRTRRSTVKAHRGIPLHAIVRVDRLPVRPFGTLVRHV